MAQFGPWVGKVDEKLRHRSRGNIMTRVSERIAADDEQIGKPFSMEPRPDFARPIESLFHCDPVDQRMLFGPLGDPLSVAAAVLDSYLPIIAK